MLHLHVFACETTLHASAIYFNCNIHATGGLILQSEVSLQTSIQDLTPAMNIIKNTRPVCNKTPDDRIV